MFDYLIHSLYTVINTQRGWHTLKLGEPKMCEILVSHNCAIQHSGLLGCGTVLLGESVPTCLWDCNAFKLKQSKRIPEDEGAAFVWNVRDPSPSNTGHIPCDLNPQPQILPLTCFLVTSITLNLVDNSSQMQINKLATARC